jgi:hypothetical protein
MKWLFRIFLIIRGCRHKWQEVKCIGIYETAESKYPHKWKHILQCKKCGNIKTFKV